MTNDGALESLHQGEIVFVHLSGGRDKYKKLCAEGKQTVGKSNKMLVLLFTRLKRLKIRSRKKQKFPRKRKAFE